MLQFSHVPFCVLASFFLTSFLCKRITRFEQAGSFSGHMHIWATISEQIHPYFLCVCMFSVGQEICTVLLVNVTDSGSFLSSNFTNFVVDVHPVDYLRDVSA